MLSRCGPRAQPVKGDEEVVPGCRVVAEHLQPPDGQEAAEVRQQPDALVVDAHVEVDRREAVVLQVDEDREEQGPADDRDPEHDLGAVRRRAAGVGRPAIRPPVAPPARIVRAGEPWSPVAVPMALHGRIGPVAPGGGLVAGSIVDLMGLFNKLLHAGEGRKLKNLESIPPSVGAFEPEMQRLSEADLRALTSNFRERLDQAPDDDAKIDLLDDLLPEAFAATREAAMRTIGQRHFDVQVMGGAALHFGWVAEMKTGEGKTLVATLPLYLNALLGQGVHLITANDYLAKRDAEWMGRIYRYLGLDVGIVLPQIDDRDAKRQAYAADITYGTNNEFGFDYLRDNMAVSQGRAVPARSPVRDRRRGRLRPHRRSPHAAHHLRSRRRRAGALPPVRRDRERPQTRPRLRGRRSEEDRRAHRRGRRPGRGSPQRRQPLRAREPELRAPDPGRVARQGAVQARRRLRGAAGRGQDRRRVHRPHPRGPPLERGAPPGGRGQGAGADQGREPDPRHGHAPELLPHVRQARGHDRHRLHGGGGVRAHVRARGRHDPHQPSDGARRRRRPHLQERDGEVRRGRRRHHRAPRRRPAGPRGHDLGREVGAAQPRAREARHPAPGAEREAARA